MKPSVCICCGEPIMASGNALSRNPNICASCSSLADGMEETNLPILEEASSEDLATPDGPGIRGAHLAHARAPKA